MVFEDIHLLLDGEIHISAEKQMYPLENKRLS